MQWERSIPSRSRCNGTNHADVEATSWKKVRRPAGTFFRENETIRWHGHDLAGFKDVSKKEELFVCKDTCLPRRPMKCSASG